MKQKKQGEKEQPPMLAGQWSKVEIPAPTSKTAPLNMSGTQRLRIERNLIIPSRGSIRIHVRSVGDVPEGSSIYVVENAHVLDQVGMIARYEPAPNLRSGMGVLINLHRV